VQRKCKTRDETYSAILGSGANISLVTKEAAERMDGRKIAKEKSAQRVGGTLNIMEAIQKELRLGILRQIFQHILWKMPQLTYY